MAGAENEGSGIGAGDSTEHAGGEHAAAGTCAGRSRKLQKALLGGPGNQELPHRGFPKVSPNVFFFPPPKTI